MSELGIQRMNNVCTAFDDMALITNVSLAMAEGPLQDGIPEKTVISYCFPYEINKSALGKNLMIHQFVARLRAIAFRQKSCSFTGILIGIVNADICSQSAQQRSC